MLEAHIAGRAIRDAEIKKAANGGSQYAVAFIAVSMGSADDVIVRCLGFKQNAEAVASIRKGQTVSALGKLELSIWDAEGGPRIGATLLATNILAARTAGARNNPTSRKAPPKREEAQRTMDRAYSNQPRENDPPWNP
ncbi:hypothetical protein [Qipengyuania gaetbuli]|uniref:hypothetical protein n=1 Tax=Qipengyuania gaetbuli TaxID=266952 RepID=UPI001CFD106B|nr:hypothetical protein [Qipengyuania gaetbuli]